MPLDHAPVTEPPIVLAREMWLSITSQSVSTRTPFSGRTSRELQRVTSRISIVTSNVSQPLIPSNRLHPTHETARHTHLPLTPKNRNLYSRSEIYRNLEPAHLQIKGQSPMQDSPHRADTFTSTRS